MYAIMLIVSIKQHNLWRTMYEKKSSYYGVQIWWMKGQCIVQDGHIKVEFPRYRPGVVQWVLRGIALLFHYRGTRRGWVVSTRPGRNLPPVKTRYPFYRRLGGQQGRSGRAENLVPTGIRPRNVQPVVSRYTDWATRSTNMVIYGVFITWRWGSTM